MNLNKLAGVNVVIVSTVPFFLVNQLSSHIYNLKENGAKVTLVTSDGPELQAFIEDDSVQVITVDIARKISPWVDFKTLVTLTKLFYKSSFSIVHSTTPKAGLLCAIASKITGIPIRLHTFTGQVWATKSGWMKWFLKFLDKVIIDLNTHCYTDSPSQRQFLLDSGIADEKRLSVYGKGSLAGVDLARFSSSRFDEDFKKNLKSSLGIKDNAFILAFIGRLTRDKGIYELLASFELLNRNNPNIELIILGPMEESEGWIKNKISSLSAVHWLGNVREPEQYLSITDVLCLPSYREGFGTVVIEAAAMGVPTVGSDIPGLVDAIDNNITGILCQSKDENELTKALDNLIYDKELLGLMKVNAKARCKRDFDSKKVNEHVAQEYLKWLSKIE